MAATYAPPKNAALIIVVYLTFFHLSSFFLKKAVLTFEGGGGIIEEISCVSVLRKEGDLERKNCKPERNLFTAVPYFYYAEGFLLSILKEP